MQNKENDAQLGAAENFLDGKPLHSYTFFGSGADAWIWMNLRAFDGRDVKVIPVRLKDQLPNNFTKEFLIERSGRKPSLKIFAT